MKKIIIKTIPDSHQRYNTVGDYYCDENGNRVFAVSDMNNWKYEFLVVVHEIIEAALCEDRGVTDAVIDDFDFAFQAKRLTHPDIGEPGDQPEAPYFREHQFATKVERMLAEELGVNWNDYDAVCSKLDKNRETISSELALEEKE